MDNKNKLETENCNIFCVISQNTQRETDEFEQVFKR